MTTPTTSKQPTVRRRRSSSFTVGYEGRSLPEFVEMLQGAGVERVVDVRALPLSRRKGFASVKRLARASDCFKVAPLGCSVRAAQISRGAARACTCGPEVPQTGVESAACRAVWDVLRRGVLTRSQVARRLGKSLATVRRIEGVLLHPVADARGVYRFRTDEVDALAERVANGEVSLWAGMQRDDEEQGAAPPNDPLLVRRWMAAEARASKLLREKEALAAFAVQLCLSEELRQRVLTGVAKARKA